MRIRKSWEIEKTELEARGYILGLVNGEEKIIFDPTKDVRVQIISVPKKPKEIAVNKDKEKRMKRIQNKKIKDKRRK